MNHPLLLRTNSGLFNFSWATKAARSILPCAILFMLLMQVSNANAQGLILSNTGQTGTSGTNWSTSGSNPVTITATGPATVNTSVIQGYLNAGTSVIVNNNTVGTAINSDISKTAGGNARVTFKDIGNVKVGANVIISSVSNVLDIILWADSDNSQGGSVDDFIFCAAGATFTSNGGIIVMAGGPDNGTNGGVNGDGQPDGFAWNGSNSATYGANTVGGLTLGPLGGTGTVISFLSNGGDIILRGATSTNNAYPGIVSHANLKIVSGTGKISIYGKSTSGHGIELTYGAAPNIAINSASEVLPAIDIKGTTTAAGFAGFWASNNASGNVLIQSTAATGGGVSIEGVATTGTGLWTGINSTNIITQVLSQSGTIALKGYGGANLALALQGEVFVGNRKDATAVQGVIPSVTAASSNILLQANDQYQFSNTAGKNTNINSSGALTIEAYSAAYAGTVSWTGNTITGSQFSSITLGEQTENYSILLNRSLTSAGNITAYSSNFTLGDGIGLSSSGAGTISINANGNFGTTGATRRTISTVNGNINVFADADASGNGQLDIDYLTFNPGTGNTTLKCETMSWVTGVNTDKPYFNGTGSVTIEPADASFQNVDNSWFVFDQDADGIAGMRLGKSTNLGNINITNTNNIAGSISLYGGIVTLNSNLTSSATGDIYIKSNTNINSGGSISGNASILKTAGSGTLTMQSQDRLNSGTITASGSSVLNVILWSDYDNDNNGGVSVGAITTNGGHLWLGGSNSSGGSYTWNGLTVGNGPSVGSVNNNFNAIDFYGPIVTNGGHALVWGGSGYGSGISGLGVYAGAAINSGSGDVTIIADDIAINPLTITATGKLNLLPDGGSYPAAITWSGTIASGNFTGTNKYAMLRINNFAALSGLSVGYYDGMLSSGMPVAMGNTSNITVGMATTVAGPLTFYGTGLTISQHVTSSAAGDIFFKGNNLSIGAGVNISSAGNLLIEPLTTATTIGLSGGAGTLAVTAANFSSNFSDGFAEIRIGNNTAGNITLGSATIIQDGLRLVTAGNLLLNEMMEIGNNDLRFMGNGIVPAVNKYITTNGVGKLMLDINDNSSKLFPVGTSYYNPVTITNHTGGADMFYATVSNNVHTNGAATGTSVQWSPRVDLTWNIGNNLATTGSGNVDLAFGWHAANEAGLFIGPRLLHYNGSNWNHLAGSTVFDLGAHTLNYTGYTGSFSPFAIAESNATLPISWLSFTGNKIQKTVALKWSTSFEQNNAYYDVERSIDGRLFTSIGRVAAVQNPGTLNQYSYTDHQPLTGRALYRLKQVDIDGKSSYSPIVTINGAEEKGYNISAVPGSQQLVLTIPQSVSGKIDLMIYDGTGRKLLQQQLQPGNSVVNTNTLKTSGIYFVKLTQGNNLLFSGSFIK